MFAAAYAEPDIGMRVDAELLSGLPKKVMLTLQLPEMSCRRSLESADVNGAAIITRVYWSVYEDRPYPRQSYLVRELAGTTSMEI